MISSSLSRGLDGETVGVFNLCVTQQAEKIPSVNDSEAGEEKVHELGVRNCFNVRGNVYYRGLQAVQGNWKEQIILCMYPLLFGICCSCTENDRKS